MTDLIGKLFIMRTDSLYLVKDKFDYNNTYKITNLSCNYDTIYHRDMLLEHGRRIDCKLLEILYYNGDN